MPQQQGAPNRSRKTNSISSARFKQYAAGGPYDLIADGGSDQCCKSVTFLAAGNLTSALLADGVTNSPLTAVPAGTTLLIQCTSITPTVAVVVTW